MHYMQCLIYYTHSVFVNSGNYENHDISRKSAEAGSAVQQYRSSEAVKQ